VFAHRELSEMKKPAHLFRGAFLHAEWENSKKLPE
jgi:hypothetical protein